MGVIDYPPQLKYLHFNQLQHNILVINEYISINMAVIRYSGSSPWGQDLEVKSQKGLEHYNIY